MTERDAWIHMVTEDEAEGELRAQYDTLRDPKTGEVDHIMRIHGQHPATLHAHAVLYQTMMYGPSGIRRPEREMIGVVVSALNHCRYWLTHHGAGLLRLTKDAALVDALSTDWRRANLSEKQRAMLAYADKLTRTPGEMARDDVEALKTAGFTEPDILDINQITGYFAYVNRLADGLGVPLEGFWDTEE